MSIVKILKDEAIEEKGERSRMASFVGAIAIADLVKTTLGPKGMDKILQSTGRGREVTVTNDGATILKSLHIDNPAAKVLVGILTPLGPKAINVFDIDSLFLQCGIHYSLLTNHLYWNS
ncbi:hypothetical protein SAY87_021516 [Trapa incisa]|uniref:T-complex protein 1 subunit beta n=1 Tax=Trapa incisa TaxID=236973 RepID=A0AAN7PS20_9MYRT|nr:hypothetical protein SAY87_021516 [Trapa incisa]